MKERISTLTADAFVLLAIGFAAFTGQVVANTMPIFGHTPVVTRLIIIEQRLDDLDAKVNRKIGF